MEGQDGNKIGILHCKHEILQIFVGRGRRWQEGSFCGLEQPGHIDWLIFCPRDPSFEWASLMDSLQPTVHILSVSVTLKVPVAA